MGCRDHSTQICVAVLSIVIRIWEVQDFNLFGVAFSSIFRIKLLSKRLKLYIPSKLL
jgi:hypothetical protein